MQGTDCGAPGAQRLMGLVKCDRLCDRRCSERKRGQQPAFRPLPSLGVIAGGWHLVESPGHLGVAGRKRLPSG